MARTDTLPHFLTDVADAIREKKGTSETIQASEFDTEIANLPSGADLSEYFDATPETIETSTINMSWLNTAFIKKIPTITIPDTVTDLSYFGQNFSIEKPLKIKCNNNITNVTYLLAYSKILIFDGTEMDTSNVTTTQNTFRDCINLIDANISNWDMYKNLNFSQMFRGCSKITNLDISGWENNPNKNISGSSMFYGCTSLKKIDARKMHFTKFANYSSMFGSSSKDAPPDDCEIIVGTSEDKEWITSRFSRLTNVKTVAEYEAEQSE